LMYVYRSTRLLCGLDLRLRMKGSTPIAHALNQEAGNDNQSCGNGKDYLSIQPNLWETKSLPPLSFSLPNGLTVYPKHVLVFIRELE
jgi:hypothetical protein